MNKGERGGFRGFNKVSYWVESNVLAVCQYVESARVDRVCVTHSPICDVDHSYAVLQRLLLRAHDPQDGQDHSPVNLVPGPSRTDVGDL